MAIDLHTHVVPKNFPPSVQPGMRGWPSMEPAHECHRNIIIDGKLYRTLSDRCWDGTRRLADMDAMKIQVQALSPMPELFSYWLDAQPANDLLRYINDQIAELVTSSNGRFVGLAAVPLQDLDLAIAEMRRACLDLGFAGVEIGSNVNGVPIGSPHFDSFFAAAQELDAAIFVHAVRPTGMDRLVGPLKALQPALAYPTDIGLAAASCICSNLLLRYPRLRIAFSHGGGTLPSLLPRLSEAYRVFPALRETLHEEPHLQARKLFYDALVFDDHTLRTLVRIYGDTQLMIGSDFPFAFHDREPVDRILQAIEDPAIQQRLIHDNAAAFLKLGGIPA